MRVIVHSSKPRLAGWLHPQHKAARGVWRPQAFDYLPYSAADPPKADICRNKPCKRRKATCKAADAASEAKTLEVPADFSVVSADRQWRVRLVNKQSMDELRRIVAIQATGFYEGSPVPFMDGMFRTFFTAEVLGELQKKVKFNPSERFAMLVAEKAGNPEAPPSSSSSSSNDGSVGVERGSCDNIVGVVEVSYLVEKEVLKSLPPGTEAFAYVASMSVDPTCQRQGVATLLLQAAEAVAGLWEEEEPVLHVYQDNKAAIQLYQRCGYEVVFQDAPWLARLGVRPRFLMRKKQQQ